MEAHKMELLKKQIIHWTSVNFEQWQLVLAATIEGLCYVGSIEQFKSWSSKSYLQNTQLEQNDEIMLPYSEQFIEYLQGDRTLFTIPVDFIGTAFQMSIWNALLEIPFGETCSYSDIAERIQKPQAVRAVGTAIGANPVLIVVPCHRVIGKNNTLTGYRSGLDMKAKLLQLERAAR
jgi:methylated-DNA-[protein]-cysteine S-methyltransferase